MHDCLEIRDERALCVVESIDAVDEKGQVEEKDGKECKEEKNERVDVRLNEGRGTVMLKAKERGSWKEVKETSGG